MRVDTSCFFLELLCSALFPFLPLGQERVNQEQPLGVGSIVLALAHWRQWWTKEGWNKFMSPDLLLAYYVGYMSLKLDKLLFLVDGWKCDTAAELTWTAHIPIPPIGHLPSLSFIGGAVTMSDSG